MGVTAVVLGAGSSTRLGRPKQSIVVEGETLLDRAVRIASEAADETIVVTSSSSGLPAHVVVNEHPEEGMASSIRCGVACASSNSRILIVLVDQLRVTAEHLRALVASDAPIAATGYAGIAGVPAVFAPQFRDALLALRGDRGARAIIEANRAIVEVVPFEDAAFDVDTVGDLV